MDALAQKNRTVIPGGKKKGGTDFAAMLKTLQKQRQLFILMIIPLSTYLFFCYAPMTKVPWAFTNIGDVAPSKAVFIGLDNFRKLFATSGFIKALVNTLFISGYKLLFGFPMPIMVALFLNEINNAVYKKSIQTIVYFPNFLSWVVVGSIWFMLLSPQNSLNSQLSNMLGSEPTYWFARKDLIRGLLVASDIWANAGYNAIVFLAAITGIDPTQYEAATMDGAGKFRQIWHITLTGIRPTIIVVLILQLGKILNIFDQVLVMAMPMVLERADVIQTYAYRTGIQEMRLGYGMAVSLFKAIFSFVLVLCTNALAKKFGEEGIF